MDSWGAFFGTAAAAVVAAVVVGMRPALKAMRYRAALREARDDYARLAERPRAATDATHDADLRKAERRLEELTAPGAAHLWHALKIARVGTGVIVAVVLGNMLVMSFRPELVLQHGRMMATMTIGLVAGSAFGGVVGAWLSRRGLREQAAADRAARVGLVARAWGESAS